MVCGVWSDGRRPSIFFAPSIQLVTKMSGTADGPPFLRRISDGSEGRTRHFVWVNKLYVGKDSADVLPTHLLLNGGKLSLYKYRSPKDEQLGVRELELARDFFEHLSQDYRNATMPPIVAVRTVVFRMYADFDLKIPCPELSTDAIHQITMVINRQGQRFFPENHPPLTCIVCTKSEPPQGPIESSVASQSMAAAIGIPVALYKHGIHFHWPDVYVKREDALYMRESMIAALERVDWMKYFNANTIDWDTVFDEAVYGSSDSKVSGSLRMTGAPKASVCEDCKNDKNKRLECGQCFHRGYIIDPIHYRLFAAYSGENVDEEKTSRLKSNFLKLLMDTDIRSPDPDLSTISEGWNLYPGCPTLKIKDERGRKRKCIPDAEGVERKFTRNPEVKDVEKERVIRKYLVKLSPQYSNSSLRIMYEAKTIPSKTKAPPTSIIVSYKCTLRGDGARFCMNLKPNGGFHKSQNVWIEIVPKNVKNDVTKNEYVASMRCFCKCKTYEGRRQLCSDFKSAPIMLESDDANILFHNGTNAKHELDRAYAAWHNLKNK